jgi:CRP-like cAMP-binding protein
MESLETLLGQQPFLQGLAPATLETLADCATTRTFEADDFVFRLGESAEAFYIVLYGRVAIEAFSAERGAVTILTLGEGDVLGWSWLVPPYRWHFDAHVLDATRVIAFDARCLREELEKDHDLGYEIMKRFADVMTRRLEATRMQLLDVYAGTH